MLPIVYKCVYAKREKCGHFFSYANQVCLCGKSIKELIIIFGT